MVTAIQDKGGVAAVINNDCSHTPPFTVGSDRFMAFRPEKSFHTSYQGPPSYATVIPLGCHRHVTEKWLRQTIENYRSNDDVFRDDFLKGVIFSGASSGSSLEISPAANELLESLGTSWTEILDVNDGDDAPSPGPYVTAGHHLLEVFRLYDDLQGAFINGFISTPYSLAQELHVGGDYIQTLSVAVPSRLRDMMSTRPLAGLRVAVKDIFQIEGVRTSICNRAYYDLYPPAIRTAGCIEILRGLGARVVGTTKLASFAATEEPIECVDFQAPWNPRADGYQSPAGSSSGSGVAVASYPWLDVAIGSDMEVDGGLLIGTDVIQYALLMEFSRLTAIFQALGNLMYPAFMAETSRNAERSRVTGTEIDCPESLKWLPRSIIYPSDYMPLITNKDQMEIIGRFVADLETSLGVKHRRVSFDSLWDESPPPEAGGQGLQEYMKDACRDSFFHDDYHNFEQFREDYWRRYSKTPYVSPPVRWRWDLSATITEVERDMAVTRLKVYREWFLREVMQAQKSNSIVIIPIESISPRYRDSASSRSLPVGVPMLFLSPITGGPELTIPVGETPFHSKVTGRTERLPVAISLLASRGRDIELFNLARECLERSGRPTSVCAGNKLFSA